MSKTAQGAPLQVWLEATFQQSLSPEPRISAYRPVPTRSDLRAEQATRVAREVTEAAAEKRQAQVARLRAARLGREAEDKVLAAIAPPKKRRATRA